MDPVNSQEPHELHFVSEPRSEPGATHTITPGSCSISVSSRAEQMVAQSPTAACDSEQHTTEPASFRYQHTPPALHPGTLSKGPNKRPLGSRALTSLCSFNGRLASQLQHIKQQEHELIAGRGNITVSVHWFKAAPGV
ncbi:unnamed protein product [Pleuronectes platessa]|uniref:Uncharacterized protein n=1 Tax=Pleuronectes platessa TaxID=8262 RepID=A0A9N7VCN8_PLEPL|nr:unnamed protein product [Pleuronectes platessa]